MPAVSQLLKPSAILWVGVYVVSIVALNKLYVALPMVSTPMGDFSWANLVVGAVFVLRDYAQRSIGHYVLLATLAAGIATWFAVDPFVAVASVTAFALSEMTDWAVFSFTRRPLQSRILISSAISVPVDTVAFLYLIGQLSPASFSLECLSKVAGVIILWAILRASLRRSPALVS
jgi:uncharacterized PurR-regulated membrane protein YhhQ (DUF165 family)